MPTPTLLEPTTLVTPQVRGAAVQLLASYIGDGVAASRRGGRQRLSTILQARLHLSEAVAARLLTSFERQGLLVWVSEHGPTQRCPGLLELDGCWHLAPAALDADQGSNSRLR